MLIAPLHSSLRTAPLRALMITLLMGLLMACAALTPEEKRDLGVRAHTLQMRDLGAAYQPFEGGALDLFSPSPKVKARTQRRPELISFHTYQHPALDAALRRANVLCAELMFAGHAVAVFERESAALLGAGAPSLSADEVSAKVEGAREADPEGLERLRASYLAARLSVDTLQEVVSRAEAALQELEQAQTKALEALSAQSRRGALADDVREEVARALERLRRVPAEAPVVATRLGALRAPLAALALSF